MGNFVDGNTIFTFSIPPIDIPYGTTRIITADDYTRGDAGRIIITGRPILPIKFLAVIDNNIITYTIIIGTNLDNQFKIIAKSENNIITIIEDGNIPGISVTFDERFDIVVLISKNSFLDHCTYKEGDNYILNFNSTESKTQLIITFTRIGRVIKGDSCKFPKSLNNLHINDETTVPSIDIDFQSLIDGSDIGNTVFTIIDNVDYYNHKTTPIIPNYTCKTIQTNNPKTTIFNKACPLIVNILRGIGNTAYEKIVYLMENVVTDQSDAYDFALLLVKYSMLKYILSRLMYGDFNINYVLNKYNNKFIKDLRNTRFCKFVYDFTNPNSDIFGLNIYFY